MTRPRWRWTIVWACLLFSGVVVTTNRIHEKPGALQEGGGVTVATDSFPDRPAGAQEIAASDLPADPTPVSAPPPEPRLQAADPPENEPSGPVTTESLTDALLQPDLMEIDGAALPRPEPVAAPHPDEPYYLRNILAADLAGPVQTLDWTTDFFFAAAFGDDAGELYTLHLSFEKPIWEQLRLAFQPFGGVGVTRDHTTSIFGLDGLLKHPILWAGALNVNIEGGGGVQQAGPNNWPDDGTQFNFRLLGGIGIELEPSRDQQLLFGARWLHVSNAGIDDERNPGVNELMLYAGWQLWF